MELRIAFTHLQVQQHRNNIMTTKYQRAVNRACTTNIIDEPTYHARCVACWNCNEFSQAYGCKAKKSKCQCESWKRVLVSETCPAGKWDKTNEVTGDIKVSP